MGIKLDMNKAYDRVEWDFLKVVMGHLGFERRWIDMVMCCVKTVEFSILINKRPGKAFKPFKGLQQGDPLSPYLFLIISEVLSLLIKKAVHQGYLEGIRIRLRDLCIAEHQVNRLAFRNRLFILEQIPRPIWLWSLVIY
ncbi:hypothetical protein ACFX14_003173 [Malus domestica]